MRIDFSSTVEDKAIRLGEGGRKRGWSEVRHKLSPNSFINVTYCGSSSMRMSAAPTELGAVGTEAT